MNDFRDIHSRVTPGLEKPGVINAVIEIPKGRRNKYELDKRSGLFKLDRHLYSSAQYPGDYGFVPRTHAEDGDPLDVLVMVNEATFPGCLIEARVLGLFRMKDQGENDYKVLCVPSNDPLFDSYQSLTDVPPHFLREVEHFFGTYKELENKKVVTEGWSGSEEALQEVRDSIERFKKLKD